jgi:outer membrane protein assembly factor BamB
VPPPPPVATIDAPFAPPFNSRPDLHIPGLKVNVAEPEVAPGMILVAPYNAPDNAQAGAMIVDNSGQVVWQQPLPKLVTTDFRVQRYLGAPVLTWWDGTIVLGHGTGGYVIADTSYRPLAHINAGNGYVGDLHEFLLTDRGTALLMSYAITKRDLRHVGGSAGGTIQDAMFQEADVATGKVLLEWHSLDHIPITESYWPLSADWDYVHLNSIAVDHDDNLLVSSRNTHTIYKLDRRTGEIIWRLGGRSSDFSIESAAAFAWQHDARRQPDGSVTMFDNGYASSRALVLNVDERHRRVSFARSYSRGKLYAVSQGNVAMLPNGNVFVGWGAQPYISEFTADGKLIFDAVLGPEYISDRAYRAPWIARGTGAPAVATRPGAHYCDVYVSWNGDTSVTHWIVEAGTDPSAPAPVARVPRTGFETGLRVPATYNQLRLSGVDASGRALTTTGVLPL